MVTVAAPATECFLIAAQMAAVGYPGAGGGLLWRQFRELIWWTQRSAGRSRRCASAPPFAGCVDGSGTRRRNDTSICQEDGGPRRRRARGTLGRPMSGGKIAPSARIVDDDGLGPVLRAGRRHTEPAQK